jgi:hypothetical protein
MRAALLGRPARGVVCRVAAGGRARRPVDSAPGWSRPQARPSLAHVRGRQGWLPVG